MMPFTKGLFTVDPNATPEQLKRKRDTIQGIVGNLGNARYTGQGLAQLAQGIMAGIQNRKMNKIESGNVANASSMFDSLFSGGSGGGMSGYGGDYGSPFVAQPPKSQWDAGTTETPEQKAAREAASMGSWNGGAVSDMQPNMVSTFGQDTPGMGKSGYNMGTAAGPETPVDFASYEQQYGLPAGYLGAVGTVESNLNPNAQNPNSSAGGMFQFIDSTAQQYGLTNKMDPVASTDAAARLAADNAKYLESVLGRPPTAGELYLAHQQGAGNAAKLLSNPNAPADQVLGGEAFRLNGGKPGMTAADFASQWTNKVDSLAPKFGGSGGPSMAPFNPSMFGKIDESQSNPLPAFVTGGGQPAIPPGFDAMMSGFSGPNTAELMKALSNPWLSQEQRSVLALQLEQAQKSSDPMYQMQLKEQQLKLAQMQGGGTPEQLAEREALARAGGLQPNTPEWNNYMLTGDVAGSGGDTPAAFASLDLQARAAGFEPGTPEYQEFMRNGGGSGTPAAFTALDLQAQAAGFKPGTPEYQDFMATRGAGLIAEAKAQGEAAGAASVGLAGAEGRADDALKQIDAILADPALPGITGNVQGRLPDWMLGQQGVDLNTKVENLKGKVFLEAYAELKGAGAITEQEGQAATKAIANLNRAQSTEAYIAALQELRGVIMRGLENKRKMAGVASPEVAQPATSAPNGGPPQGVDPALWDVMTPEEKALWQN